MASVCLAVGLHILSGFVIGSGSSKEISVVSGDSDISKWRWPYIHEEKIPIPFDTTTLATPTYNHVTEMVQQDPTPRTRHNKKRRKKKKKKKDGKRIKQLSATGAHVEIQHPGDAIKYDTVLPHEAKVHVMLHRPIDASRDHAVIFRHPDDPIFSASATLMDFDEDPKRYLQMPDALSIETDGKRPPYGVLPLYHFEDDLSLISQKPMRKRKKGKGRKKDRNGSPKRKKDKRKDTVKIRIPVRALIYDDTPISLQSGERYVTRRLPPLKHQVSHSQLVGLHSPTRIFVPVWEKGDFNGTSSANGTNLSCIRCPTNATLIAKRGIDSVVLTIPPVAICPSLARRQGTLNLAVTSGPRPGTRLTAGEYPVHLIAWKSGGHVSSCRYTVFVKVRTCPTVEIAESVLMNCPNGSIWGSVCKFQCASRKDLLHGVSMRSCEENGDGGVDWTAPVPSCSRGYSLETPNIGKPCKEPKSVIDGAVVCGVPKQFNMYADKTVCQYFCYPGFTMAFPHQHDSLIVCEDDIWVPSINVKCVIDHCSQPDMIRKHGTVFTCGENDKRVLNGKTTYVNGSNCYFGCKEGFFMPDDQLPFRAVRCLAPTWNTPEVPDCMRAEPPVPHPGDCKDVDLVVDPGVGLIFGADLHPPRFFPAGKSKPITPPTCTLSAKTQLRRGLHINNCKVEDPQTGLSANCTYHIKIRERVPPKPDPRDCSNKVVYTTLNGEAFLKVPKFYSYLEGKDNKGKVLPAKCTYSGNLEPGSYINWCSAYDKELNVTGNCTYAIEVKARSCPVPKKIPNAQFTCDFQLTQITTGVYPPDTICEYACEDGYIIPKKFHKRRTRKCRLSLKWSISVYPFCKKAIAPQFYPEDCQHQVLIVEGGKSSLQLTNPRLKSFSETGNVHVQCALNDTLSVGNYSNHCLAEDSDSGLSSTCIYDISVRATTCPSLLAIEFGDIMCSVMEIGVGHPISSVCSYVCHADYTIPTSQLSFSTKNCMANEKWNSTTLPSCLKKTAPQPDKASCQDTVIETNDVWNIILPSPSFLTSNGSTASTNCSPTVVEDFGILDIFCDAYDTELRTFSSCNFTVTVLPLPSEPVVEKEKPPIAVEPGCIDYLLQAKVEEDMAFVYPEFKTERNTSANVTCTPVNNTGTNFTQMVTCHATDTRTNLTTSCNFNVTLYYPEEVTPVEVTTPMPSENCPSLDTPVNGYISCKLPHICEIGCSEGLGFSLEYPILRNGLVTCDKITGTWDFQRTYNIGIPDCLRELLTTSVEVSLKFKGAVETCSDPETADLQAKITTRLLQMNYAICQTINCTDSFAFSCTEDEVKNRLALEAKLTIRASAAFDPQDYEDSDEVPLVETEVEKILETTKKAVTTNNDFQQELLDMGLELWPDSYSRSHILLVCDERGFMVDPRSDKCVECPVDTEEIDGKCERCPKYYYQDKAGQTMCLPCLQTFNDTAIPQNCIWDMEDDFLV